MGASADTRLQERKDASVTQEQDFPRFLMRIGEEMKFLPMHEAGVMFDSGWVRVEIGGIVLNADYSARIITLDERDEISRIADEHSANK